MFRNLVDFMHGKSTFRIACYARSYLIGCPVIASFAASHLRPMYDIGCFSVTFYWCFFFFFFSPIVVIVASTHCFMEIELPTISLSEHHKIERIELFLLIFLGIKLMMVTMMMVARSWPIIIDNYKIAIIVEFLSNLAFIAYKLSSNVYLENRLILKLNKCALKFNDNVNSFARARARATTRILHTAACVNDNHTRRRRFTEKLMQQTKNLNDIKIE